MESIVTTLILGVTLFVATDIDDLFILVGFFADPRFNARQIVVGQYLGIGVLVLASLVCALIALVIPLAYIGLLGLVPIAMGAKQLLDLWRDPENREEEMESHSARRAQLQTLAVAAVTIANGGDNIGVYTPVFAVVSIAETAVIAVVFVVMTALWCAFARWLVHHRTFGAPIRRYGYRIFPVVLIGIGILIMLEARTFDLLRMG
jgi:cadmium resistance transport/sequestration family protein